MSATPETVRVEVRAGYPDDVPPATALLRACRLPVGGFPDDVEALVAHD